MEIIINYSMFDLILQSDLMTKLVLFVLLCMSVLCWALFFYKLILLNIKKRQLYEIGTLVKRAKTVDEIRALAVMHAPTFPGYIIAKILVLLKMLLSKEQMILSDRESVLLQQGVDQLVEEVISDEESYLSLFSSCAAVSPLLGLFGTVWGLVHAFLRISEKQQADIATVAPGLAEALITTLAGLLVAIPSLIMFHYLNNELKKLQSQVYTLADGNMWLINTMLVR